MKTQRAPEPQDHPAIGQLTILAPGLLGGSVARAARARNAARRIVIWARRREVRKTIAGQPWCDQVADTPAEAVRAADFVIIAATVDAIIPLIRQIAPALPEGAVVSDVGSVKGRIVREGHAALSPRAHFVGAHPMAGSEKTGWENGSAGLFELRTCFVTPLPETDGKAIGLVAEFWKKLGAKVATVSPEEHDKIVAHISHLPQLLASSLCSFLAEKDSGWLKFAGGGLRDTTRIAGGDPGLWRTILEENKDEVLRALRAYQIDLQSYDSALAREDWEALANLMAKGRACRERLAES
jgi:prephenate dehydrogenase